MPTPRSIRAARRPRPRRKRAAAGLTGCKSALFAAALLSASLAAIAPAGQAATFSAADRRARLSAPAPVNPRQAGNNTFQFALGNGMQVLVIPDHRAPVV